jgi:hypothetical protein
MGPDEWEGEFNPGAVAGIDKTYAILSAYGGALAEAKLRRQDATGGPVRFDHTNDELPFINGQITHPGTGFHNPGRTSLSFIDGQNGAPLTQLLITASFHGDVQGPYPSAHAIAVAADNPAAVVPLCRWARELLDLPAVWYTIQRFALRLEGNNHITAPAFRPLLHEVFEEETALAARELWLARGQPAWDDQRDWYVAQGRA